MWHVFDGMVTDDEVFEGMAGNLPLMPGIFPNCSAPIMRHGLQGGWQLTRARRGVPTPPAFLAGKRTDSGVTNFRNLALPHQRCRPGAQNWCLVPSPSFSAINSRTGAPRNHPVWFALSGGRPLASFGGIRIEWTSVRMLEEGEVTAERFGFLTCAPEREVSSKQPKAMKVLLTHPGARRRWLTASAPDALQLQRRMQDGSLQFVSKGVREDAA